MPDYIRILYIKDNIVEEVLDEPIDTLNTYVVRVKNGLCSLDVYENKNKNKNGYNNLTEEQKIWHKRFCYLHFMLYFCIIIYCLMPR